LEVKMLSTLFWILVVAMILVSAMLIALGGFFFFAWVLVEDFIKYTKKNGL